MYTETIDLDDIGLSIAGEQYNIFEDASAVCEYLSGEKGIAEFQGCSKLILKVHNGPRIEIDVDLLPQATMDAIDEAVRPQFESWMDSAGDVSPADYDPPPHDAATASGMYDHDDYN